MKTGLGEENLQIIIYFILNEFITVGLSLAQISIKSDKNDNTVIGYRNYLKLWINSAILFYVLAIILFEDLSQTVFLYE